MIKTRGHERICKDCGKVCFGFQCRTCFRKGRRNTLSKRKGVNKLAKLKKCAKKQITRFQTL